MAGLNKLNEISSESLNLLKMSYKEDEEIWKYTSSKNFDKFKNLSNKKGNIEKYLNHHSDNDILIVNNRLINNPFNQIKTNNLAETINDESIFNLIIPKNKNKFILYNTAYFNDGVTFQIPDNSHIQESLYINNIIDFNDINSYLNCRFLFTFGNNVNATIIIKDIDLSSAFLNIVYEVFVGENSKINFIIDSEKPNTTQIFNLGSEIKANSDLNIYTVNTSGKLLKNNYFINLNDINSSFNYNSINLLNNNDYVDNYIEIIHNNKHTISNTNQKNILSGKSNSVFYSKAIINQNGAKSEVIQKNNNILLSENANVHSNPQLEIYNDDVKCSHGSTTGQLDDEAIFYIRSRGISLKDAHKLLLNGFLNEFTSSISDSSFKENISKKINDWLSNVN
tara:strand:- start:164 stop:1348 length:1185 start_codon:yes stop_codon:yes gene_type:complete